MLINSFPQESLVRCMKRAAGLGAVMQRSVLAWTLAGHRCDLLTITDFSSPPDVVAARECVVLTGRVHPGETCASWMMQASAG